MPSHIADELAHLRLPDARLERRTQSVIQALAAQPQSSLAASFGGWSETQAAYRLMHHPGVTAEAILAPHRARTLERMAAQEVVLCVEDTTFVSFGGKREGAGLGPHTKGSEQGFSSHVMLAVGASDGCALGVLSARHWVKDAALKQKASRKTRPIQEKESYRWVAGIGQLPVLARELPAGPAAPRLVYVADRESDIFEVMEEAKEGAAHFLLRASHDRICADGRSLHDHLAQASVLGTRRMDLPAREGRPARKVKLEIRATTVQLPAPARLRRPAAPPLEVAVVEAREAAPPAGTAPVHWILYSSLPVESFPSACEKIDWYTRRWVIEVYFKTLKSGCRVEAMQLQSYSALTVALSLYMIVAWRVLHLVHLGRSVPDLPCECLFSTQEWRAAWLVSHRSAPPENPPTLATILDLVARLGGYLGRHHDPPPGPKAIWSGLTRVRDFALALASAESFKQT